MTASGPVFLAALLFLFLCYPSRLPMAVLFFAPFSATAIANINSLSFGLTPAYVSLLLLFAAYLFRGLCFQRFKVSPSHLLQVLLLGSFAVANILTLWLNEPGGDVKSAEITQTLYLMLGLSATILLSFDTVQPGQLERAVAALRASALFVAGWAVVQGVCFYGHIPYPAILFNNSAAHFAAMYDQDFGRVARLASVATEPSVMAGSLLHFVAFGATVLVMEPSMRTRPWMLAVGGALLVILASTSSTGYFGLLVLTLLLGMRRPLEVLGAGLALGLVLGIVLALSDPFREILWSVTFGKSDSYSYAIRSEDIQESFAMFRERPLFGWGWGTVFAADFVGTILGNSGLLGGVTFAAALLATVFAQVTVRRPDYTQEQARLAIYAAGARNALLVAFVVAQTSGFKYYFLDDWCYWGLAIAAASKLFVERRAGRSQTMPAGAAPRHDASFVEA